MELPHWLAQIVLFFSDGQFLRLGIMMLVLFGVVFVSWWIYRSLADRNLFTFLQRHGEVPNPTAIDRLLYAIRYVFLFPLYSFAGFLIIACSLFLMAHPEDVVLQEAFLFLALALVGTVRIAAYVSESLAEDISKVVPLNTLVTILVVNPVPKDLGALLPGLHGFVRLIPSFAKYLVALVILEVVLRFGAWVAGRAGFDPKSEEDD